jgi:DNA-nicking Smr family endonuclease
MPRRPRTLSEHDRALWHAFARDIRLLPGRAPLEPPVVSALPAAAPAATTRALAQSGAQPGAAPKRTSFDLITGIQPAGLDRASWHRFHGGRLAASRTLDLHGKTAQAAFLALQRFLYAASADHVRCVEIITGRGSGETGGVIRRELPLWLNLPALRPLVLAAAHPHALNPGSTRLLLRRQRG